MVGKRKPGTGWLSSTSKPQTYHSKTEYVSGRETARNAETTTQNMLLVSYIHPSIQCRCILAINRYQGAWDV